MLVLFWEPLEVQPQDMDVKALLRQAVLYNVPTTCNRATADYLVSSPLFGTWGTRIVGRTREQRLSSATIAPWIPSQAMSIPAPRSLRGVGLRSHNSEVLRTALSISRLRMWPRPLSSSSRCLATSGARPSARLDAGQQIV